MTNEQITFALGVTVLALAFLLYRSITLGSKVERLKKQFSDIEKELSSKYWELKKLEYAMDDRVKNFEYHMGVEYVKNPSSISHINRTKGKK